MPAMFLNAGPATGFAVQQRIYLDESGTLGYSGEIFTMALVLVDDLPKLEACTLKNRTTQQEVKASQMKTAQKLALARTLLEQNDIRVYLAKLDPIAAAVCERKLDKEFLYDSMVAQALAFYLERGSLPRDLPYRVSMDMRGGLRESYEDMVGDSIGTVLMRRDVPLVTGLDVRFLDSKYSAGVQAADLFSNIYRTALTQTDSPCLSFLHKFEENGQVHSGFTFGLPELADQMTQIASELRARVEFERANARAPKAEAETTASTTVERTPLTEAADSAGADAAVEAPSSVGDAPTSENAPATETRSRRTRRSRRGSGETTRVAGGEVTPEAIAPSNTGMDGAPATEVAAVIDNEIATGDTAAAESSEATTSKAALPFAPEGMGTSRSARRRRARAARREREAENAAEPAAVAEPATAEKPAGTPDLDTLTSANAAPEAASAPVDPVAHVAGETAGSDASGNASAPAGTTSSIPAATDATGNTPAAAGTPDSASGAPDSAPASEAEGAAIDVRPGRASRSRQSEARKRRETQATARTAGKAAAKSTKEAAKDGGTAPAVEAVESVPSTTTHVPDANSLDVSEPASPAVTVSPAVTATPAATGSPVKAEPATSAKPKRSRKAGSRTSSSNQTSATSDSASTKPEPAATAEAAAPEAVHPDAVKPATRRRTRKKTEAVQVETPVNPDAAATE